MMQDIKLHVRRELGSLAVQDELAIVDTLPKDTKREDHATRAQGARTRDGDWRYIHVGRLIVNTDKELKVVKEK